MGLRRALSAAVVASACSIPGAAAAGGEGQRASSGAPVVTFVSPKPGGVYGRTVVFKIRVRNFRIDDVNINKRVVRGAGHAHFSMDGGRLDFPRYSGANGQVAARSGTAGRWSPAAGDTITYRNLPPGRHVLAVRLADNLHAPLQATARIAFTVR